MTAFLIGVHLIAAMAALLAEQSNWMRQAITYEMVLIARYADL